MKRLVKYRVNTGRNVKHPKLNSYAQYIFYFSSESYEKFEKTKQNLIDALFRYCLTYVVEPRTDEYFNARYESCSYLSKVKGKRIRFRYLVQETELGDKIIEEKITWNGTRKDFQLGASNT